MEGLRQIFIANLKYYRKLNHIRQLDLALEIGKSSNYINSIENGKYFPSPETIDKIAGVLKIESICLFDKTCGKEENQASAASNKELANKVYEKVMAALPELIKSMVDKEIEKRHCGM